MIKLQTITLSILFSLTALGQEHAGHERCHSTEYLQSTLNSNPELVLKKEMYHQKMAALENSSSLQKQAADQIVSIPVVFHILYKTNPQNIDDARIYEQIERLNLDYSGSNPDTANVPAEFKPFIADTKIRFHLATTDPDGNPTTGITRTETELYKFSIGLDDIKKTADGGKDPWNTNNYLNIWVGNIDGGILGYALPPFAAGTSFDGVVISYRNIGNNSNGQFDLGRTGTHEVGHYLGLDHIWGPGAGGCGSDDGIADTPLQFKEYYGINTHPQPSCGSNDMFMNFMDYGNDEMLIMFSKGQQTRMEDALDVARSGLGVLQPLGINESTANNSFEVYPNPSKGLVTLNFGSVKEDVKVQVVDVSGRAYYSSMLQGKDSYELDLTELNSGLYFITVLENNKTTQQKIVINN